MVKRSAGEIVRVTALISSVVLVFVSLALLAWQASSAILIVLVGILVAIVIDAAGRGLDGLIEARKLRLLIVMASAALLVGAAIWWGGTTIVQQAGQFVASTRGLLQRFNQFLSQGGWGLFAGGAVDLTNLLPSGGALFGGATQALTTTFGVLATAIAIFFLGAFLAWEPEIYKNSILSLLPKNARARVDDVMDKAGDAMRHWLMAQAISVGIIFTFALAALLLIGMPYPILLAVQAGLLAFIPTVGPFIAGVVIILAGLAVSLEMALYGMGVYVVIQFLETNLITPMVQKRAMHLPPAITVAAQLVMGALFGLLGLVIAVPLAAAAGVIISELYVKDSLGGKWKGAGRE